LFELRNRKSYEDEEERKEEDMAYNVSQKLQDNIRAIELAIAHRSGTQLLAEDIANLRKYSGFGGIKAILFPQVSREDWISLGAVKEDLKLHTSIMTLHELLKKNFQEKEYKEIINSLKNSVLTAFYTPEVVPSTLYRALKEQGLSPKRLYEPSAGAGIFITEAVKVFPDLQQIAAVEKDTLTGMVLTAINENLSVPSKTYISGLEHTPSDEKGKFDLVVSNIPFGNFSVFDKDFPDKELSGRIHNYFFAKGLEKLAEGGLMAYITTDAFLNSPSNQKAREYLFMQADFVTITVMPDNLMKDTGNTEAANHLLLVQKNTFKDKLSQEEIQLCQVSEKENDFGSYTLNHFLDTHSENLVIGNVRKPGTNQYGKATETIWQEGDINGIQEPLLASLQQQLANRIKNDLFFKAQKQIVSVSKPQKKKLTYLPMPESKSEPISVQLGLFDTAPAESINRATAYITPLDEAVIRKDTAKLISTIRTTDNPTHEALVLLTARRHTSNYFLYKLYSNVKELSSVPANWMDSRLLSHELNSVSHRLKEYNHTYKHEGDQTLQHYFRFEEPQIQPFDRLKPFYKAGTLVIHLGMTGRLEQPDDEFKHAVFRELPVQSNQSFYEKYIGLRDSYLQLSARELTGQEVSKVERDQVSKLYDDFVSGYGILNLSENKRRILEDTAFGMTVISSLERRDGVRFVKADILTDSVVEQKQRLRTENPVEALAHSLNNFGKVDIQFIGAAMGLSEQEVVSRLGNHIYLNPAVNEWETADRYLAGNVVEKLTEARQAILQKPENIYYKNSFEAISSVQPEKIPFELLDFNLGERWIPVTYYQQYASQLFEQSVEINYFSSLDVFKVTTGNNTKVNREYAIFPKSGRPTYGYTLLEHALENTNPFYTYEVTVGEKTIRIPDNEAIQLAHQKIDQMRTGFVSWLKELADSEKKELETLYNNTYNCYVLREYDGSHLTFPGLDKKALGIQDLYSSQKNATWRVIQNRGALIDHEVGLGKTLTMIVSAQEMKRLGIVHKPMILALKANINQIAETYRTAYPNAKILAPGEVDFTPAKRLRLFHEIRNNNWDCILLTHDQFGKIPQPAEIHRDIFVAELDNVEQDLATVDELGGDISKKMLKGLEIRKNNLENKLNKVLSDIENKKDRGINFKDMGVDHLFVDESHKFKNLTFTTRHNRVAGLGNIMGSQKALNMLFAVRTLQQKFNADLCVTFLSGTPISNSLTEMYLIFKYLRPKEMERQQIANFDAWAAVFTRKTVDFEFSVTNEIIAKERFRHFIKVPELALFYNEITDYKTAKHINLDKPELKEILVNIRPTPEQSQFTKDLMAFARTGNGELIGRGKLSPEEDKGRMLIATNYAKKMAADMRLINRWLYSDHPDNKVNNCARNVAVIYHESSSHKGTQLVFSDIGTPKPDDFNIYDALKDKLISDFSIPGHHITFIHDWTDKTRPELFRKMNNGEIRILIGSTEKAGTGLNVQERVVALHQLDIPWKPSELEQRNGRGARQGNWVAKEFYDNKVRNYIYAVEQSLDNYKFNLLKNKQTFISQMKNCELNVRCLDEGAVDEKSGMNFSEYIAILSGDTSLLEKSKLEKKIAVAESLKTAHYREITRSRQQLEKLEKEKVSISANLEKLESDESLYRKNLRLDRSGVKENPIHLAGLKTSNPEVIGKHIIELYQTWKPQTDQQKEQKIGTLYGFDLYIRGHWATYQKNGQVEHEYSRSFYATRGENSIKYTYNGGVPNTENPKLSARYFLNAIDRVVTLKENYIGKMAAIENEMIHLDKLSIKPFVKEQELQEMKNEMASLERRIAIKIQENQLKQYQKESNEADSKSQVSEVNTYTNGSTDTQPKNTMRTISETDKWQQKSFAEMRRNRKFKL
jgi:N12 class adenine-specific DNA methylase